MIIIAKNEYNRDEWCNQCNKPDETCKDIKISVRDNRSMYTTITLCAKCRKTLLKKLVEDLV